MVRRGVLESLGEVIFTFNEVPGGPPVELLRLFLGRESDRRWWEDWLRANGKRPMLPTRPPSPATLMAQAGGSVQEMLRLSAAAELEANPPNFFDEPARFLLCAFNLPALVLTLGREKWEEEVRDSYLLLAAAADAKVVRTLAASSGEIAKVVGPEHAARDVLPVWRAGLVHPDAEVRLKAIEALEVLLGAVHAPERVGLLQTLDAAWGGSTPPTATIAAAVSTTSSIAPPSALSPSPALALTPSRGLRGFREREAIAKTLCAFVGLLGQQADLLAPLLHKALCDDVAAVREAAVSAVVPLFDALVGRPDVRRRIWEDISLLAGHESFRKRMTWVFSPFEFRREADGVYAGMWRASRLWCTERMGRRSWQKGHFGGHWVRSLAIGLWTFALASLGSLESSVVGWKKRIHMFCC